MGNLKARKNLEIFTRGKEDENHTPRYVLVQVTVYEHPSRTDLRNQTHYLYQLGHRSDWMGVPYWIRHLKIPIYVPWGSAESGYTGSYNLRTALCGLKLDCNARPIKAGPCASPIQQANTQGRILFVHVCFQVETRGLQNIGSLTTVIACKVKQHFLTLRILPYSLWCKRLSLKDLFSLALLCEFSFLKCS
ncbi:hypothetical protein BGZ60DRAFT_432993 [Tricladium varicosporioides]|nr:hypothetical protein BGZ60DRAFT_432993 [Hymenoscyphus varicosporioides]